MVMPLPASADALANAFAATIPRLHVTTLQHIQVGYIQCELAWPNAGLPPKAGAGEPEAGAPNMPVLLVAPNGELLGCA